MNYRGHLEDVIRLLSLRSILSIRIYCYMLDKDRETDRQMGRELDILVDKGKQMKGMADRKADIQTGRQTNRTIDR